MKSKALRCAKKLITDIPSTYSKNIREHLKKKRMLKTSSNMTYKKYFEKLENGYKCLKCDKIYFDIDNLIDCCVSHEREGCLKLMKNQQR